MMINKRLIGMVSESKKYIAGNVAWQWCALAANIAMIGAICRLFERLFQKTAGMNDLLFTGTVEVIAVVVRFLCNISSARMSYLSSRAVKKILREKIYAKLLRLGSAYREQVRTSEAVQVAVEGVEQLETYFGAYLPPVFLCRPGSSYLVRCFVLCKCAFGCGAACLCVDDPDCYCCGADLGKKTFKPLLGSVYGSGRYVSGKSAGAYRFWAFQFR